jgi:hypothetical protein
MCRWIQASLSTSSPQFHRWIQASRSTSSPQFHRWIQASRSTSSPQFHRWIQVSSLFHVLNLTVGFKPTNCNTFLLVGRSEPLNLDLKVAVLIASFVKSEPLDQEP